MKRGKTLKTLERECQEWNSKHPVGTLVKYHAVIGSPASVVRTIKTEAQVLSGHTAVLWLEGMSGCVALEACEPAQPGEN
jgi:hypothetical protein